MARPTIPESEKRRTVPFRMTKPDYRALLVIMRITDTTIQEHLRDALHKHVVEMFAALGGQVDFKMPSAYEIGSWNDEAFQNWLAKLGQRQPQTAKRGGLKVQQAAA